MLTIKTNWFDAERWSACLGLTINDLMAEAGADAAVTLQRVREAAALAAVQQRFLESLAEGLAGELLVTTDATDHREKLAEAGRAKLKAVDGPDLRLIRNLEEFSGGVV